MSYKINKYPDNSSYVSIEKLDYDIPVTIKNVMSSVNKIVFKVNSYEDLWHLNQVVDAYNNLGVKPTIVIPNLIDAQADKRFAENQSNGLKLVCKFLNSMNAKFHIFHPHNPEVVEALINNVKIIDNKDFIVEVLDHLMVYDRAINGKRADLNTVLLSSDAGGFKPLMKLCDKIKWEGDVYSASKSRKYENGESKLIQVVDKEDFEGKDIFIVDDICVYGGTFKGLAKILRTKNIGKLYLAVSHITIERHKNFELFDLYDMIFTTNSKFDNYYVPTKDNLGGVQPKNLKIINLF